MQKLYTYGIIILFILHPLFLKAQHWDSLRSGFNLPVDVMYADSSDHYLYAAGAFYTVDQKPIKGIARWNGTFWDSLKSGIDGLNGNLSPQNTHAIARYNNKLYVGGAFTSLGNKNAVCIGTWDGTDWDTLSEQPFRSNFSSAVLALEVIDSSLYVGGIFDSINGLPCHGIAKWNGSAWTLMEMPPMDFLYVNSIKKYKSEIYVAGNFNTAAYPNDTIQDIVKYDGVAWTSVGGGLKGSMSAVEDMAIYNNELYVAGAFSRAEGNIGNFIQKWDGNAWSDVGGGTNGINGQIHHLQVFNGYLYAMGIFQSAGGVPAMFIARWDGTNWCDLGSTFDNGIETACVFDSALYIGGGFWNVNGLEVNRIAKWTGGTYADSCGHLAVGINELSDNDDLMLYPNPSGSVINLEFATTTALSSLVFVQNTLGQTLQTVSLPPNQQQLQINISDLPSGIYFIRLQTSNYTTCKKFVKE